MYRVFECLTQEHNLWLVLVAATVCVVGSSLSILLLRRVLVSHSPIKSIQVGLAGLMSGVTIWATHFVAMLAFDPGLPHAYAPFLTTLSLVIAAAGTLCANITMAYSTHPTRFLVAGVAFGTTVSVMHYTGMAAYQLPGTLEWKPSAVVTSLLFGIGLGALAYHRLAFPVTRICWLGGAIAMVLAICSMHFVGMSAFTIVLSPLYEVPAQSISDHTLGSIVIGVTFVIFVLGFAALNIEQGLLQQAHSQLETAVALDILTGLPNRHAIQSAIQQWDGKLSRSEKDHAAVFTINIDGFRHINELHGRDTGDAVLCEVANRLKDELQPGDLAFRVGGDEFVFLASGFRRIGQVTSMADRIIAYLAEPLDVGETQLLLTVSAGVACSFQDGRDMGTMLEKSGMAMFYAKANPDLRVQMFDVDMQQQSRARLELQNDLRQAIAKDQLELVYQKQNALPSRDLVGFEVLLRWNHPSRGRVSPVEFIPIAEETGLIRDIGLWVMRTACEEAARWSKPLGIAVNVAPQQLIQPSFVESVSDILFETRLPPGRLELEITEASIIDDEDHTLRVMHRLKAMGLRIAMDDFGTGYSSLATLQSFPFDKIKIDRSFVKDVHANAERAAIVRATLLIGEALKIPVLAEGAEFEEELAFLSDVGCGYVQGFYFGTPLSLSDVRQTVDELPTNRKASG